MERIYFNTYLKGNNDKYYSPSTLIRVTEDIFEKNLNNLRKEINEQQILVTSKNITTYLEERFEFENPKVKKRLDNPNKDMNKKELVQKISDEFIAVRYSYDSFTLNYFKKYTEIVRKKALLLIDIIDGIGHKNIDHIKEEIKQLDIVLDKDGRILKGDIIRLLTPTISNINILKEKTSKANDLSTYLAFKASDFSLIKDLNEDEIYPDKSLQIYDLLNDYKEDNVKLTENQKQLIEKDNKKIVKHF